MKSRIVKTTDISLKLAELSPYLPANVGDTYSYKPECTTYNIEL